MDQRVSTYVGGKRCQILLIACGMFLARLADIYLSPCPLLFIYSEVRDLARKLVFRRWDYDRSAVSADRENAVSDDRVST
jgi:hypothetical protein